jgi:hypothetical protein
MCKLFIEADSINEKQKTNVKPNKTELKTDIDYEDEHSAESRWSKPGRNCNNLISEPTGYQAATNFAINTNSTKPKKVRISKPKKEKASKPKKANESKAKDNKVVLKKRERKRTNSNDDETVVAKKLKRNNKENDSTLVSFDLGLNNNDQTLPNSFNKSNESSLSANNTIVMGSNSIISKSKSNSSFVSSIKT